MQVTIRGLSLELEQAIKEISLKEGISLNKAALKLMAKGANLHRDAEHRKIGRDLDHLFGTWPKAEAKRFLDAIRSCEQIDEDFWK